MSKKVLPKAIYIDALALVPAKKSGVGVTLEQTLNGLSGIKDIDGHTIYLVLPLGKARYLKKLTGNNVKTKTILLPARALAFLLRLGLLPPVDWFLGTGVYVFPNYRNWPLWHSRSLTYVYDTSFLKHPETVQPQNRRYLQRHIHRWVGRTDKVITISEQVRNELEKLLDVHYSKIAVVPCGVDTKLFRPRSLEEIEAAKTRYKITFDKYFLYVGNIEPRKNLLALMETYKNLPAKLQQAYGLVLVGGDGWSNQEVITRIDELRQLGLKVLKVDEYVSYEDLPAIYSGASILVHPAIYEGFGMTPLEAMACGIPVAVSNLPAIKEVVSDAGTYFDPYDPAAIGAAIIKLLEKPDAARQLADKGHRRAKELSWKTSALMLCQAINQEIEAGPHRHPALSRIRNFYKRLDLRLRKSLGEYPLEIYRPPEAASAEELRQRLIDDFLKEQPNRLQYFLLRAYVGTKRLLAQSIKKAYGLARFK